MQGNARAAQPRDRLPAMPGILLHLVTYALAGLVLKRMMELLRTEQEAWYAVGLLILGGAVSLVMRRHERWLRALAAIAALATVAGCFWLNTTQKPPAILVIEYLLVGLLLAQGLGASTLRHYALLMMVSFALLIAVVRHLGALPPDLLLPLIVLGVSAGVILQGSAPALVQARRATRPRIPWPALAIRIIALTLVALIGGRWLAERLPPLREDRGDSQTQIWITYLRTNLGLNMETHVRGKMPAHQRKREVEMLNRNTNPALLNLSKTYPNSLTRRLLYVIDAQQHVYLRTTVLDHYSGLIWAPSMKLELAPLSEGERISPQLSLPDRLPTRTQSFNSRFVCKIWPQTNLGYELAVPVTGRTLMRGNLERVYRDPLNNLYSNEPIRRGMKYEVLLGQPDLSAIHNVRIGNDDEALAEQYLQLPPVSAELIQHCQKALDGELLRMAAVHKLISMVRAGKSYSRSPIVLPSTVSESTEYFLFEMNRGACTQFASALTVACRIVGIPARIALGYVPGYTRTNSMMLQVREMDAHAWTQIWFPDYGWVDVDATPGGIDLERTQSPDDRQDEGITLNESSNRLVTMWQQASGWVITHWQRGSAWISARKWWPVYGLVALLASLLLLVTGRLLGQRVSWWWRWHRADRRQPREAALARYQCLLEWLRRFGYPCEPHQTPDELAHDICTKRYPWAEDFATISATMQQFVFGPQPPSVEESATFRQQVATLRRNLKPPAKEADAALPDNAAQDLPG